MASQDPVEATDALPDGTCRMVAIGGVPVRAAQHDKGLYYNNVKWSATAQHNIRVCWDAAGSDPVTDPSNNEAAERLRAQHVIEKTWESYVDVDFTGWGVCGAPGTFDIALFHGQYSGQVTDAAGVQVFGRNVKRIELPSRSVHFNQDYGIVHEFGHALGLAHEQLRPEFAQNYCPGVSLQPQPANSTAFGNYDRDSIMNGCSGALPALSAGDIATARALYGSSHKNTANHEWQRNPSGLWTTVSPLNVGGAHAVASVQAADGTLHVFHIGDNSDIWHSQQVTAGGGWVGPVPLNVGPASAIAAVTHVPSAGAPAGFIEVFHIGQDHQIYHEWQTSPSSFTGPIRQFAQEAPALDLAAGLDSDGSIELFYIDAWGGYIQRAREQTASWSTRGIPLRGESNPILARSLAVASNKSASGVFGYLELFHIGLDGELWHEWQSNVTLAGESWTAPISLNAGGALALAAGTNLNGTVEVFHLGNDGNLWHEWQKSPSGAWTGPSLFQSVEGGVVSNIGHGYALSVAQNFDGRLEVFHVR
jgi:hypothetical protein